MQLKWSLTFRKWICLTNRFFVSKTYKNASFTNLTLDNQTRFIHQMIKYKFYKKLNILSLLQKMGIWVATAKLKKIVIILHASIQYEVTVPAHSQLYVNVPNLHFSNDDRKILKRYNGQINAIPLIILSILFDWPFWHRGNGYYSRSFRRFFDTRILCSEISEAAHEKRRGNNDRIQVIGGYPS